MKVIDGEGGGVANMELVKEKEMVFVTIEMLIVPYSDSNGDSCVYRSVCEEGRICNL